MTAKRVREGPRHATEAQDRQASQFSSSSVTPPADCVNGSCCTPDEALAWVVDLLALALENDPDALRCLPAAATHHLNLLRRQADEC